MPVVEEFQVGISKWVIEFDDLCSPPYLKNLASSNQRHTIVREALEGTPQVHLSRDGIPLEALMRLAKAFHDWESGTPLVKLAEGWTWERVKGPDPVWAAVSAVGRCAVASNGVLDCAGAPMLVVRDVLKVWESRKGLYKANAVARESEKVDEPVKDSLTPTRSDLIREGALNEN